MAGDLRKKGGWFKHGAIARVVARNRYGHTLHKAIGGWIILRGLEGLFFEELEKAMETLMERKAGVSPWPGSAETVGKTAKGIRPALSPIGEAT